MRNSFRSASAPFARSTMNFAASATKFFVRITSGFIPIMVGTALRSRPKSWDVSKKHPYRTLDRAMRLPALGQILLVIFLPAPKLRRRLDLSNDLAFGKFRSLAQFLPGSFRHALLLRRMIENH